GRRIAPVAGESDVMAERSQFVGGVLGNTAFEVHPARGEFVIAERAIEMLGLEAWGLDGFLRGHAEFDDIQHHLQQSLVLIVAAGRGEREERLAILEYDGRAERDARPFS